MDCYIIRNRSGNIMAVYHRQGNIYYREKRDDTWTYPEIIGKDARPAFTIAEGHELMAVYQNTVGGISVGTKGREPRILLENKRAENIIIHYIPYNEGARLIFNSEGDKGEELLTELHRTKNGWSPGTAIDPYIPSSLRLVNMGGENNIIIYVRKSSEYQLGYRELTSEGAGSFKMLYTSVESILDYSAAVTDEALYLSVITSGRRSGRVVYIKKDSSGISQPIFLWEGKAELCVIGIIQNKLCLWWKNPFGVFKNPSLDMGRSFRRAERCGDIKDCRKSGFINKSGNDPDGIVFTDMLVSKDKVYEPLLI